MLWVQSDRPIERVRKPVVCYCLLRTVSAIKLIPRPLVPLCRVDIQSIRFRGSTCLRIKVSVNRCAHVQPLCAADCARVLASDNAVLPPNAMGPCNNYSTPCSTDGTVNVWLVRPLSFCWGLFCLATTVVFCTTISRQRRRRRRARSRYPPFVRNRFGRCTLPPRTSRTLCV